VDEGLLGKGLGRIRKFLDDGVAKEKVTAEARDRTLANLQGTTSLDELADCDVIIEAIIESGDEKKRLENALIALDTDLSAGALCRRAQR
jgi:3-hydroxyacyl-CoA dehydrogenase